MRLRLPPLLLLLLPSFSSSSSSASPIPTDTSTTAAPSRPPLPSFFLFRRLFRPRLPVPVVITARGRAQTEARETREVELKLLLLVHQLDQELAASEAQSLVVGRLRLDVLPAAVAVGVTAFS